MYSRKYMIEIAAYPTLTEANTSARILRKVGIKSVVESDSWFGNIDPDDSPEGPFRLLVAAEDEEDACLVLDSANIGADHELTGQRNMLIGGVIGSVGLLTSFGDISGLPEPWGWIPYGMVVAGAMVFYKGTREEKEEV